MLKVAVLKVVGVGESDLQDDARFRVKRGLRLRLPAMYMQASRNLQGGLITHVSLVWSYLAEECLFDHLRNHINVSGISSKPVRLCNKFCQDG